MATRILALLVFFCISPLFVGLILLVWLTSRGPVFFIQTRIGQFGKPFKIIKFRSMHAKKQHASNRDKANQALTPAGKFLRKYKLDELPELINIIKGEMAFVGPRPDVPGFADQLQGEDRKILDLKPGLTGPATLKYINEADLLVKQEKPYKYKKTVIFPDKVKINLKYVERKNFFHDLHILWNTLLRKPLKNY